MFSSVKEFSEYVKEATPINFGVYYSPISNQIKLGLNGKEAHVIGSKGIFFTKGNKMPEHYVKIGDLTK